MSGSPGQCAALSQCPNLLRLGSESGAGFLHHRQGSLRQAPVAERPVALPPENQGAKSCHCYSNHRRRRVLSAAPRLSEPAHSRRANGFSRFDAQHAGVPVRTRSIIAPSRVVTPGRRSQSSKKAPAGRDMESPPAADENWGLRGPEKRAFWPRWRRVYATVAPPMPEFFSAMSLMCAPKKPVHGTTFWERIMPYQMRQDSMAHCGEHGHQPGGGGESTEKTRA